MLGQGPARLELLAHVLEQQRVAPTGRDRGLDLLGAGPAAHPLVEQRDRRVGRQGPEPFQIHQALVGQLGGGARQRRRPGPGRHDHADR